MSALKGVGQMQMFARKTPDLALVYREVLFDQLLTFLKPVPGEEVVLELVRSSSAIVQATPWTLAACCGMLGEGVSNTADCFFASWSKLDASTCGQA
jgi:hypothetical protein